MPPRRAQPSKAQRAAAARRHIALTNRIARWLERADVQREYTRTLVAIDLADGLAAAAHVRRSLAALLRCDPATAKGAKEARLHAARIEAWNSSEIRYHFGRLAKPWGRQVIAALGAPRPRKKPRPAAD